MLLQCYYKANKGQHNTHARGRRVNIDNVSHWSCDSKGDVSVAHITLTHIQGARLQFKS